MVYKRPTESCRLFDNMANWDDDTVASTVECEKAKVFRKWAFTINCDLLNDTRLNDKTFYVEGQNLSLKEDNRGKTVRSTVWIGALEGREEGKKHPYNHRHCAVENTSGSISKMTALNMLATYLNIPVSKFTCGHEQVVPYSQPALRWPDYVTYMFKALPGRSTSDEEKIQQVVIKLRRDHKRNPTSTQVKEYLLQNQILSFRKVASTLIKQQIDLACEVGDLYKSSSSEDGDGEDTDDGLKFIAKMSKLDDQASISTKSASFFEDILETLVKQLRATSSSKVIPLHKIFEVIALMLIPLFIKRNSNDHETRSLVLYGKSKTGKSFIPMQLVKAGKLHLISTDAKGVGRFDAPVSCNGFFFDDVKNNWLLGSDAPTIKNLTAGDEASVKVFAKSTSIRGWTIITCQSRLLRREEDESAWARRLFEICFDDCDVIQEYTTVFDIVQRSNVDEILTFLYYVIHKPETNNISIKDWLIKCEYYDSIISCMFDKLKHGQSLLRLLNHIVVKLDVK